MEERLYPLAGLHGQVAHRVGRRIVTGEIAEGTYLPREAELAEEFSVSRQAVREALKVLAAKGLVSSRRRAGTSVKPRKTWNLLDPDVLAWHGQLPAEFHRELFELRHVIEPAAAAYAATRGSADAIARIGEALDGMRTTVGDPVGFQRANIEFHMAIFAASGNTLIERLNMILGPLLAASYRALEPPFPIEDFRRGIEILSPVYDAIHARDPGGAHEAMEQALFDASKYVESWPTRRASTIVSAPPREALLKDG